ncbi:MAG: diacylglycerol kinase family protein [bacterium]|nr:diacylglycerol kinase family protein [bacterium]
MINEKIKFLVNPLSGGKKKHQIIDRIEQTLISCKLTSPADYQIEFTNPDDISNQVISACQSYEKIVAAGGDGTVGQVIQGIVQSGTKRKLGIIPLGTANDLSRTLGLYRVFQEKGLAGLINIILRGRVKNLDVLSLNDKFIFSNYFSLGLDAKICRDFNLWRSKKIAGWKPGSLVNKLFYIWLGLKNLGYYETGEFSITIGRDDQEQKGAEARGNGKKKVSSSGHPLPDRLGLAGRRVSSLDNPQSAIRNPKSRIRGIIVSNIKDYASGSPISRQAEISDGKFEVTIIKTLADFIRLLAARFLPSLNRNMEQYQANRVRIEGTPGGYFQLDGEDFSTALQDKDVFEVKVCSTIPVIC